MEAQTTKSTHSDERPPKGPWVKYWYDKKAADRAVNFIERQVIHVEGAKHAGKPFKLEWWQKKAVRKFFGWKRRDTGARRYRTLFIFVPRKNGKTAFASALALYLMFADKEPAAQIVCAAADKAQAGFVFNMASQVVVANPLLAGMCNVYKASLFSPRSNSSFKCLSKKPNTKHGANLSGVIADEVHAIEDRELIDVLTTGTIARKQPMVIFASTAGYDKGHFFYTLYSYAKMVQEQPEKDETWLNIIYEADADKWKDPEEWKRANPNFGVTMDMESFEADFRMALEVPAYENTFKRLRLNIWTEQDVRAIPMDRWAQCVRYDEEDVIALKKQPCFIGLDLSSTTDITAAALVIPPFKIYSGDGQVVGVRDYYDIRMKFWTPEGNIALRKKRFGAVDIEPLVKAGYITLTPGEVIDYDQIRKELNDDWGDNFRIKEIAFDPWNATQLSTQLDGDGFTMVQFRQGFATMSDPTKNFIGLILENKINHHNNPVLEWHARNLQTEEDPAGNLKPSKRRSKEKIDGMVAVIMAIGRALVHVPKKSAYETRGVRVIG